MAADVGGLAGLAGRYANALFELALDGKQLDEVAADLESLDELLGKSNDLERLVRSPVISRDEQMSAMDAIARKAKATKLVRGLFGVLAERRRLYLLADVITAFKRLHADHRGEVRAEVASASKLTAGQVEAIRAALAKAVGGAVAVDARVDTDLIGGLVVRVGSRMVDESLKTKLDKLHMAMRGTGR